MTPYKTHTAEYRKSCKSRIVELLRSRGFMIISELAKAIGEDYSFAATLLSELYADGKVKKKWMGQNLWSVGR